MSNKILVVDDETEIADLIEVYLKNENYTVFKFYTAQEALNCIETTPIDLAILDIMLPDIDGFTLCKKIREHHTYPIIMLTAKDAETDKITGLTLGADDYITKPFRPLEMIARVKSQLRRYQKYNPAHSDTGETSSAASEDNLVCGSFWKALHHVVEHHAAVLVVEQLRVQEIVIDALHVAVDAADERRALPRGFLFLHDVEHHAAHGGAGLCAPLVVHKMYDGHTAHRPSMTDRSAALTSDSSPAAFSRPMTCTLPMLARTVRRLMLLPMPLSWRSSSFCSSITTIRLPRQQAVT